MTALDDVELDYRAAFLGYLSGHDEAPLHVAYQIGRTAVTNGLSILDVAQVHHRVLLEVLRDTRRDDLSHVAAAASEFFLEVLATFEMAAVPRRHADSLLGEDSLLRDASPLGPVRSPVSTSPNSPRHAGPGPSSSLR